MVHAAQVHQLMDQDVVPHRGRHQHQPPVQADVRIAAAGTPARTLVANADARHDKAMAGGKLQEARWQLAAGLLAQRAAILNRW